MNSHFLDMVWATQQLAYVIICSTISINAARGEPEILKSIIIFKLPRIKTTPAALRYPLLRSCRALCTAAADVSGTRAKRKQAPWPPRVSNECRGWWRRKATLRILAGLAAPGPDGRSGRSAAAALALEEADHLRGNAFVECKQK